MITTYIISSSNFSIGDCLDELVKSKLLENICKSSNGGAIFEDDTNVFIQEIDFDEMGYEEEEIKQIEALLGHGAKTFLQLEYNEGKNAVKIVVEILKKINVRWPIVFDNCYGRRYNSLEISQFDQVDSLG